MHCQLINCISIVVKLKACYTIVDLFLSACLSIYLFIYLWPPTVHLFVISPFTYPSISTAICLSVQSANKTNLVLVFFQPPVLTGAVLLMF